MRRLRAVGRFARDFVVGDDPLIAAAVVLALALTAALESVGISAWWLLPAAVVAALALSLDRASRRR
jgi:hypothetical protein